jgi:hypothetical protein
VARYGIDYYGVSYYGPATPVEFSAPGFVGTSVPIWVNKTTGDKLPITSPYIPPSGYKLGYSGVNLSWVKPTGNWNAIKLVRNSYGFPTDSDDGDILVDELKDASPTLYQDINLQQGRTYYYSLFVESLATGDWVRAGNAFGIFVKDFNSYERMYRQMPNIYRSVSRSEVTTDNENTDLQNFLALFAFEYDLEKTYATNLMYSSDTTFVDGRYIPQMMKQFGLKYEPEIGLKQSRSLLRNAIKIYKTKGSYDGLITYLKAFTGYDVVVTTGVNKFLDFNCSSFEEGIGFWASTTATLSQQLNISGSFTAYIESTAPSTYPNSALGALKVLVTSSGTVDLDCGLSTPITKGIPVSPGTAYSFSIYGRANSTNRTATATIKWFDRFGNYISSNAGTGLSLTTGGWNVRPKVINKTAPALAAFAVPSISIASATSSEIFYFDAAQFEAAADASNFEEARVVKINAIASRINELLNPNFDTTAQWTSTNSSVLLSSGVAGSPSKAGTALIVRPTTAAATTVVSEHITTVIPSATHTFSVYVQIFAENSWVNVPTNPMYAVIKWFGTATKTVSNKALTSNVATLTTSTPHGFAVGESVVVSGVDATFNGTYLIASVPTTTTFTYAKTATNVTSAAATGSAASANALLQTDTGETRYPNADVWIRPDVTGTAPANASYAIASLVWTPSNVAFSASVDEALFEKSAFTNSYFDGNTGVTLLSSLFWEGATGASRSHYYKNRLTVQGRLNIDLPNYLTEGTKFQIDFANPNV